MYKIFVVDDEAAILERIAHAVDWSKIDCELIGTAINGEEALEKTIELKPDIAITDIRMPVLDGIGYIKKLHEASIDTKIIILSGYGDFEYVQNALRLGAADYLLKPAEENEILTVVKKCIEKIVEEQKQKSMISSYTENLPKLKEKFYLSLLNGQIDIDFYNKQLELFNIETKDKNHIVFIIHIDWAFNKDIEPKNRQILEFGVSNIVDEILGKLGERTVLIDSNGEIITVLSFSMDEATLNKRLAAVCNGIKNIINKIYNETVTIGIGNIVPDLFTIKNSFQKAKSHLYLKDYFGDNKIYMKEENPDLQISLVNNYDLKDLTTYIKLADREKTLEEIDKIISAVQNKYTLNPIDLKVIYFDIMFSVIKDISESRVFGDDIKFFDVKLFYKVNNLQKISQFEECLKDYIMQIVSYLESVNSGNKRKIVDAAIEYINKNYKNQVSLKDITDEIYLNPSYFCKIFKNETGLTFKQYLMKFRIDKAIKLLSDPRKKIYEVAAEVGYTDVQYFTKIFKSETGLLPTQYREKLT